MASKLAEHFGIHRVNVTAWKRNGVVPAFRCAEVERITGVRAESLNPSVRWHRVKRAGWPDGMPFHEPQPRHKKEAK